MESKEIKKEWNVDQLKSESVSKKQIIEFIQENASTAVNLF